jgi:phospholipid/cholesterol/gamma-HCH transport system permease protein
MITAIGRSTLQAVTYLGQLGILTAETARAMFVAPIRWKLVFQQILEVGSRSQIVVAVTGAFTGAVFAAQIYFQFHRFGMDSAVGSVASLALFRELGPTLSALMVSGRVGAAIAAEIGTMKVTEQIDALRSLGVHPIDYLVVPRSIAMMVSMPLLVAEACAFGIAASYLIAVPMLGVAQAPYLRNLLQYTHNSDIAIALIKGFVFAIIIVCVSCHEGLETANGAAGVGRAPTRAVVISSLAILGMNLILTFGLNIIFPGGK